MAHLEIRISRFVGQVMTERFVNIGLFVESEFVHRWVLRESRSWIALSPLINHVDIGNYR